MPDQLDERIREALRSEVAALPFTLTAVAVERRLEPRHVPLRFAVLGGILAAVVLMAVALIATGLIPAQNIGPPGPATLTLTPTPAASLAQGGGPALSLEEVPLSTSVGTLGPYLLYDGQRFVSYGTPEQPSTGYTSTDGRTWEVGPAGLGEIWPPQPVASWNGTVLTWNTGTRATVINIWHPDGSSTVHQFSDASIDGAAMGPLGIVVLASTGWDESGQMIDPAWEGGWFSETGQTWTEVSNPPRSTGPLHAAEAVAAGPDGFYARTFDGALWRSADGMDWEAIAATGAGRGALLPWRDGVVSVDPQTPAYEYWTADGGEPLQIPAGSEASADYPAVRGVGPVGIFTVDRQAGVVIASADGQRWSEVALPGRNWVNEIDGSFEEPSIAVGDKAALVLLWEWGPDDSKVASLWRLAFK